jgi:hypothetical protein
MAEIAIPRIIFADILRLIAELRPPPNGTSLGAVGFSASRQIGGFGVGYQFDK